MKNIVVCGDSFCIGIGCKDLNKEPFGSLLASKYDKNLINFAKGSSTNWSIYLQVKYAIENVKDIDFLILGVTSYNRIQWMPDDFNPGKEIKNTDINYHQYPPYGLGTYNTLLKNPLEKDKNYKGKILTENFYGILDYVKNIIEKKVSFFDYYNKFKTEPDEKLVLLKNYYYEIFDERIQKDFDIGIINLAHTILKKNNIKHYILCLKDDFKNFINDSYLIDVNWLELSHLYPDEYGSLHTSEIGHNIVFEKIIKKYEI